MKVFTGILTFEIEQYIYFFLKKEGKILNSLLRPQASQFCGVKSLNALALLAHFRRSFMVRSCG